MLSNVSLESVPQPIRTIPGYFTHPLTVLRSDWRSTWRPDALAGLTVAVILLPQAIAYALIADLPPSMGIAAAIVGAIVGALWGSSHHLHTGPTNAASLLVLGVLLGVASPDSPRFLVAAGMLAVMAGLFRVAMGVLRLGILVNFVSDSVIVGFTAGAGVLISVGQLRHLFRLEFGNSPSLYLTVRRIAETIGGTHLTTLLLGLGTMAVILLIGRFAPKLPAALIGMVAAASAVALFGLDSQGVRVLGELPRGLPPLAVLPIFDLDLIAELATGALAVGILGLIEATSIARSISTQSGQRLDNNQEFVGQGLASVAAGFFSGYPVAGSFSRSAVNFRAGAVTPMASLYSGLFMIVAVLLFAPLAAYVPRAALAGVLLLTAYRMVDIAEMRRLLGSSRGNAAIMIVTLLATLLLPLQFAVLAGIMMSLAHYIVKTSTPNVRVVLPDEQFRHFIPVARRPLCPQLGIVDILGSLYFGAVSHVEDQVNQLMEAHPEQRFLLLRMHSVPHCDMSGIYMLESIMRGYRARGGDIFFVRVQRPVLRLMISSGFVAKLGRDRLLDEDEAIGTIFTHILDPAICIYECPVRAFKECQNLPKKDYGIDIPLAALGEGEETIEVEPRWLWDKLHDVDAPHVIDVREPREFKQGHVPTADLIPLGEMLEAPDEIPLTQDDEIVLTCRSGRRSARAAALLRQRGYPNVSVLRGGLLNWESCDLLEAIGENEVSVIRKRNGARNRREEGDREREEPTAT